MKHILGLDLGTNSIGWALVFEAENEYERSLIERVGVRVISFPNFVRTDGKELKGDAAESFNKGKGVSPNAKRTAKRGARRNLQRYKSRRDELIKLLKEAGFIAEHTSLSESGSNSTHQTYRLRARAVVEKISLEELARVLLMINKSRGYKSNRKAKGADEGALIDGMDIAMKLYDENLTPGELSLQILQNGKKGLPNFYRSDLQNELDRVWSCQQQFYPEMLTETVKQEIAGKNKSQTWDILAKHFSWMEDVSVWNEEKTCHEIVTEERKLVGIKRTTKGREQTIENYRWRTKALTEKVEPEILAIVLQEINGQISNSSGYLGAISDRSKLLYFKKQTVGQYLFGELEKNPHNSLRNKVFYRQDYLDEFNAIWEKQAEYHKVLTEELKREIRDVIIFYQRRLKSQKGLISICEFERQDIEIERNGKTVTKTVGRKVIPRSHPLFQEFHIWQTLNDIVISDNQSRERRPLYQEEKCILAEELAIKESLTKQEALKLLFENPQTLDMNFDKINGNHTGSELFKAYSDMIEHYGYEPINFKSSAKDITNQLTKIFNSLGWNTQLLAINLDVEHKEIEEQDYFRLWHLLYSFESDDTTTGNGKLIAKLMELSGAKKEYANILAGVTFLDDYGSLSAKAIKKIQPFLKDGNPYSLACEYAGYRHSKASLTKEEIEARVLDGKLKPIEKNSLRNPVVEKILNQLVNVVNAIVDTYGRPDEIRVELARELKKSISERKEISSAIAKSTHENEKIRSILETEFGLSYISRKDIIKYKLYKELEGNGFKTLYSDKYIPREKLFSKEIDIEHIIPKTRVFDDSFSNKTLEFRNENIEKSNLTAYDFVKEKYGEEGLQRYIKTCKDLFKGQKAKLRKLTTEGKDIASGFIERDLRTTQYISKKALEMLHSICRRVVATSGEITAQLREDWQLVDVMKELNLPKYESLGLTYTETDRDGRRIKRIKDWAKRNDHRHHAMDALTVAFTRDAYIQYFNNKNAYWDSTNKEHKNITAIRNKYFDGGKAKPPMPAEQLRAEAKAQLEKVLISLKPLSKVATHKKIEKKNGEEIKITTPRGQLHDATIYGSQQYYTTTEEKINASFDEAKIATVVKPAYRQALLQRLADNGSDPKKAFTNKNSLKSNPIYLHGDSGDTVPEKVAVATLNTRFTIRKDVKPDLKIDKVIDEKIRQLLQQRLEEYEGDAKKAFANLEENPIWFNKEKGIQVKRVTTTAGISNGQALHEKKDKDGNYMLDKNGNRIPNDFVQLGNNHHVSVYKRPVLNKENKPETDEDGNIIYTLEERVISFFEAVSRANLGLPIIDKSYKRSEGWIFLFSMKQNEYFVFPNEQSGFDPKEIDLTDPVNYARISPNLFRVQTMSKVMYGNNTVRDYKFRHHLEATLNDSKELRGITFKQYKNLSFCNDIVKVRINHLGAIIAVGEY